MTFPLRDHLGNIIPPGRVHHKLEYDPLGSAALPSWMTSSDATVTPVGAETGAPGLELYQSGPPWAQLNVGPGIMRDDRLVATSIRVEGLESLGAANYNAVALYLSNAANDDGVEAGSATNSTGSLTTAFARGTGTSNTIYSEHRLYRNLTDANLPDPAEQVYRGANFGLMVNWQTGQVFVFDGDQVVISYDASAILLTTGLVMPRIRFRANEGAKVRLSKVRLDSWYI